MLAAARHHLPISNSLLGMNTKATLLFSFIICCLAFTSKAQYSVISGNITDAKSAEPLIGASVRVSSDIGTITDVNGYYELRMPHGDYTVVISYVGYETIRKKISLLPPGESVLLNFELQTASEVLNTVTVTSGKYEKPLGEVTVSLEVLQPGLIESSNKQTLDQAIEKIPGVQVIDGQANIRGGSGYSFGAGSRVLLLQDDIPILQQDVGFPNWFDVPMENVAQIEVVKGAASALYGSAALNGIVNFRTAFAKEKPETKASVFYTHFMNPPEESLKWWDKSAPYSGGLSLTHKQKFDKLDLVLGGAYQNQQPHLKNAYRKFGRFNLNTRYRFTDRLSAGLNANLTSGGNNIFFYWIGRDQAYEEFPGTNSRSDFTRYNIDPYITYFDGSGNRHKLMGRIYSVDNKVSSGRSNASTTAYAEYQFQRQITEWELVATAGLVYSNTKGTAALYGDTTMYSRNLAAYAQLDKKFFDRLNLSVGFRFEENRIDNPGFELSFLTVEPSLEQESNPVWRFGMNYQALDYTFLRASYGQGYRFPTIGEKFIFTDVGGFSVVPNPSLRSETAWSAEIGLKQGFKVSSFEGFLDISAFWTKYMDMMEFNLLRVPDLNILGFQSINIGDTRINGYEISVTGRGNFFGLETQILAGYLNIDPRFLSFDPSPPQGEPTVGQINANNSSSDEDILKYRSRESFKLDIQSKYKRFTLGAAFFYASHQEAIDAIFNLIIPGLQKFREENDTGYRYLNARLSYQASEQIKVSLLMNNVFNTLYILRPGLMEAPRNLTIRVDGSF